MLVEEPLIDTHPAFYAIANASGIIVSYEFAPDHSDLGVRFYLTATGSVSQAQNTFTDANLSSSITFPANGGDYNNSAYNAGCTPTGICGTVTFNSNSSSRVLGVSIKRISDGFYWNGSSFISSGEIFNNQSMGSANGSLNWNYAFAVPANGSYLVRSKASDNGGTETPGAGNTFTIENTAPITASVTTPVNGTLYGPTTMPANFSGSAADNSGGGGLAA